MTDLTTDIDPANDSVESHATCICGTSPATCPFHGTHPIAHDTYAEHCRQHVPGTSAHSGGRCRLCDLEELRGLLDGHGTARATEFGAFAERVLADPVARSAFLRSQRRPVVFWEPRDVWIGYYRGDTHHYVCPIPCLVIRWPRKPRSRSPR